MSWEDVLSAAAGGLQGYVGERRRREDRDFEEKKLAQQGEIQKLKEEIRVMLAEMNEGGRMQRHVTPSANVELQQDSATTRTGMQQAGATERTGMTTATTLRGQDLTHDAAVMRDDTTRRGQDLEHDEFGATNDRLWNQLWRTDDRSKQRNWLTERGAEYQP